MEVEDTATKLCDGMLVVPSPTVRLKIIGNEIIKNVGKSESCMVSKLPIIFKRTRSTLLNCQHQKRQRANSTIDVVALSSKMNECCHAISVKTGTDTNVGQLMQHLRLDSEWLDDLEHDKFCEWVGTAHGFQMKPETRVGQAGGRCLYSTEFWMQLLIDYENFCHP